MIVQAGNAGKDIRSDCLVEMEPADSGGIRIELVSKVERMYGSSIRKLVEEGMRHFGISNARIRVEDQGALPFVIMARLEAAARQIKKDIPEFLLPMLKENEYPSSPERHRFSRLYLPGNTPKMMLNAGIHKPHGIILDLEDSVAPAKKAEARVLVRNALRAVNFYGAERMVRINQWPAGREDLEYVIPHRVHTLLVPKCEDPEQIAEMESVVETIRKEKRVKDPVFLMPIIESALGVEMAYRIACSSKQVVALAIGLEDYTADLGTRRSDEGTESFYARSRLVNACKAARIQAIDSVFSDVADMEGLARTIEHSKKLGFEGMGCIHPRQIPVIHAGYAPGNEEIEKARKIVLAYEEAESKGLGVVSVGTKMIDPPVVKRALRIMDLAVEMGIVSKEWRNEPHED